jgi:hypothetical protein
MVEFSGWGLDILNNLYVRHGEEYLDEAGQIVQEFKNGDVTVSMVYDAAKTDMTNMFLNIDGKIISINDIKDGNIDNVLEIIKAQPNGLLGNFFGNIDSIDSSLQQRINNFVDGLQDLNDRFNPYANKCEFRSYGNCGVGGDTTSATCVCGAVWCGYHYRRYPNGSTCEHCGKSYCLNCARKHIRKECVEVEPPIRIRVSGLKDDYDKWSYANGIYESTGGGQSYYITNPVEDDFTYACRIIKSSSAWDAEGFHDGFIFYLESSDPGNHSAIGTDICNLGTWRTLMNEAWKNQPVIERID